MRKGYKPLPGHFSGQVTIINLLALAIALLILAILEPAILQPTIDATVACLNGGSGPTCPVPPLVPNAQTALTITVLNLSPAFLFIALIITGLIYAIPRKEGY